MKYIALLVACVLIQSSAQGSTFRLVNITNDDYDGSICMDGSRGVYYVSEGAGANAESYLIYFQGGELCGRLNMSSTLENCAKVSETPAGSSKHYTASVDYGNHSLLSADPNTNPNFHDWTRIHLMSCDGIGHQGSMYLAMGWRLISYHVRG